LFAQFKGLDAELNEALAAGPAPWREMWRRDKGVMDIASEARAKRLAKALG